MIDFEGIKSINANKKVKPVLLDIGSKDAERMAEEVRALAPNKRLAFVSGNFNIFHPGDSRLLNFAAECADFLIVGVNDDSSPGAMIPQQLRLEGVQAIGCVDLALLLPTSPEQFISYLKPDIVVKGSEHEQYFNPEKAVLDSYGGKLLFSSGEVGFSSANLLKNEFQEIIFSTIRKPIDYLYRHAIQPEKLPDIVRSFTDLSIVVIGDLIVDEYITCDALGISREDPTIVVSPIKNDLFVGGAAIVAAHAKSLGAKVSYFSVVGNDETANFATQALKGYGVDAFLMQDNSRPTTLKQRYRVDGKTLLRVSHLRHHNMSNELSSQLLEQLADTIKSADLVVFSDFNYGCLPQNLVDSLITLCQENDVLMVADSQSSSQIGDVSRFHGMTLITPTEHEARLAVRDQTSGLTFLAEALRKKCQSKHIIITLGAEGLLIDSPKNKKNKLLTDQLPAFNSVPKDVSGGGDCLLICTSLALAAGASIWESAYLGSVAAACHVGRIGNSPLSASDVLKELQA